MGGVVDGQPVNQAITNPAFIIKNADDATSFKLGLGRPADAPAVDSAQGAINKLYNATGASESVNGRVYGAQANTITDGDSHQTALAELAFKFHSITGHKHTGAAGDAPLLSLSALGGVRTGTSFLTSGVTSTSITFSTPLATSSYATSAQFVNIVDSSVQFQPITVTSKTISGFDAKWNVATDSINYAIEYIAMSYV